MGELAIRLNRRAGHVDGLDLFLGHAPTPGAPPCGEDDDEASAPSAPTCQSGGIRMKPSSCVEASVSVSEPITAPIGETIPPTNSPPPRMTPAIESRV